MKRFTPLFFALLLIALDSHGQSVPQGMKYQAVARDLKGQVMDNQFIQLKISLYSDPVVRDVAYMEIHKVYTNELGLFTLSIGEGISFKGSFESIPWSSEEVWMEVAVQLDDETDFITISDSRMLSVPYAFHAATAGELAGNAGDRSPGDPYTKIWNLTGNAQTNPARDKLGTNDLADLVIVTNDTERMRVLQTGDINMVNSLRVGRDLNVRKNVYLNTDTIADPHNANYQPGQTINYGNFTVENQSSTYLTGTLTVDEHTELNSSLNVDGLARVTNMTQSTATNNGALVVDGGVGIARRLNVGDATHLGSTLTVQGATAINNTLGVSGITTITNITQSISKDIGALVVEGGVGIEKNLYVGGNANFGGTTSFGGMVHITDLTQSTNSTNGALVVDGGVGIGKNLNVGGRMEVKGTDSGFLARIDNADAGTGDGLEIKLGKTHPAWNGSDYLHLTSPGAEFFDDAIATINGWIDGSESFDPLDLLDFIPAAYIAGTACNLVNLLTEQLNESIGLPLNISGPINDALGLPLDIGAEINSGIGLPAGFSPYGVINDVCDICVDDDDLPGPFWTIVPALPVDVLVIPAIPAFSLPAIPQIPICDDLPSFTLPVISFVDVDNSLDNENQFISFKDVDNRELGSIRAQSVTDWQVNFFSGAYIVGILASVVGIDFVGGIVGAISEFTNIADAYNSIGVEYASGNGDYAEWLERINPSEVITEGDIVGVMAGKITKDLTKAEQVMAVSSNPIVLGNTPKAGLEGKGNKIAFMGQIPVKVQGPVSSGDYIVGNTNTPGYGVAVSPAQLTQEQALLVVGRAWDTNLNAGPKMINTVIGVDNGQFLKVMQDNQSALTSSRSQVSELESRVKQLESKMELIINSLPGFHEMSAKMEKGILPKQQD